MKLKIGDSVFVWYLESILRGHAVNVADPFDIMEPDSHFIQDNSTIITERVFKSEIFQTLLKEKIDGLY